MTTTTLILPVFNEEDTIRQCLDHIAAQHTPFDECIIVDNGCTDTTMTIVAEYEDRLPLRIIDEPRQGVMWARATGFNAARGDILCRIDADTRLYPEWTRTILDCMTDHPELSAVTGYSHLYGTPMDDYLQRAARNATCDNRPPTTVAALSGCNMAIRRTAWHAAAPRLVNAPTTHEDTDLSHAVVKTGGQIALCPTALAAISARRFQEPFTSNLRYLAANYRTVRLHGDTAALRKHLTRLPLNVIALAVMKAIVGPYDPRSGKWRPFRRDRQHRVSPIVTEGRLHP